MVDVAVLAIAARNPADLAEKAVRRAAEQMVFPVVNRDMSAGPAQATTGCILDAASPGQRQALARDLGVEAGTLTVATIRSLATRPGAQGCLAATGMPPPNG